jgi:hypothetical protein
MWQSANGPRCHAEARSHQNETVAEVWEAVLGMAANVEIPENLYICGFYDPHYWGNLPGNYGAPEKPPCMETEICKRWLKKFVTPRKNINRSYGSYWLKHRVENWADYYIPNGSLIQAAIECGYRFRSHGPNAWFNVCLTAAKQALVVPCCQNEWRVVKGCGRAEVADIISGVM